MNQNPTGFEAATAAFRTALQQSWASPQDEQRVIEAYQKYSTTLLQAWQIPQVSAQASAAFTEYMQQINQAFAPEASAARIEQTLHQYAHALKAAWATADPETMTLDELDAIAEGMKWVIDVIKAVRHARELNP